MSEENWATLSTWRKMALAVVYQTSNPAFSRLVNGHLLLRDCSHQSMSCVTFVRTCLVYIEMPANTSRT